MQLDLPVHSSKHQAKVAPSRKSILGTSEVTSEMASRESDKEECGKKSVSLMSKKTCREKQKNMQGKEFLPCMNIHVNSWHKVEVNSSTQNIWRCSCKK